ncbi:MAG: sugar diacid recognition domain-containing protein [Veillonellales bacterium]
MIISDEMAQKIVDTTMCLVHRNVNIMNREGIIIATGHPHRYKTFHKGAKDVIETGSVIEIYPDELPLYPGALQGVNLPIVFDGQTVGVVGVFGSPDEVRSTGRLVRTITELILERELLQKEMHSKYLLREQFIDIVIANASGLVPPKINRIAKTLGLKMQIPRAVALIDATSLISKYIAEYGSSELVLERAADLSIQKITELGLINEQDIAVMLDEKFIILKCFPHRLDNKKMHQWAENLIAAIASNDNVFLACGIGAITGSIHAYHSSYEQAKYCLSQCQSQSVVQTIYDRDIIVRYALQEAAASPAGLSLKNIAASLSGTNFENTDMQTTLLSLLENNLNINATADQLHIHRNTLLYRLTCLKNETALDPSRCIDDAILCKLLLIQQQTKQPEIF